MFALIDVTAQPGAQARGLAYGRAARAQIHHSVATYARLFAACGIDWVQATRRAQSMRGAIEALDASLLQEMQGIAEGSAVAFDSILALNCRTEILPSDYLDAPAEDAAYRADVATAANLRAGIQDWTECTSICVGAQASVNGHAWLAQNWDWIGRQRAALVVLRVDDGAGRQITTLTEAGMLAKIGLNDAGFALGLNIVRSVDDGQRSGVPVHILLRHLLSSPNLDQARSRLRAAQRIGFAAASNVPCADASGDVACFEVAPTGWAELPPSAGTVVHTNHFLCESLRPYQAPLGEAVSSAPRLATAAAYAAHPRIGLPQLQAFLRDESDGYLSICRSPNPAWPLEVRMESVAGIIIDIHERLMWIAPDVPSRTAFSAVHAGVRALRPTATI